MTVRKVKSPVTRQFSRNEGWAHINFTNKDQPPLRGNVIDTIDYPNQRLVFRIIEAGPGLRIDLVDAHSFPSNTTPYSKLVISLASAITANLLSVQVSGGVVDPAVNTINFRGIVSAVSVAPGVVDVIVSSSTGGIAGVSASVSGVGMGGGYTELSWVNIPDGVVTDAGGGVLLIDLSGAFTKPLVVNHFRQTYPGPSVNAGTLVLPGFFGTVTPAPDHVTVSLNGLVLTYSTNPSLTEFDVVGNDLIIDVTNLGYPVDPGDVIQAYSWT